MSNSEPYVPGDDPAAMPASATGPDAPPVEPAPAAASKDPGGHVPRQTLAGRVWFALACAVVLLVLLIIFIAENSRSVTVSFLGAHGHISLALAMLIAVAAGIVITLLIGSARIVQLSLEVRRQRRRRGHRSHRGA